jgi:hypothetical protein
VSHTLATKDKDGVTSLYTNHTTCVFSVFNFLFLTTQPIQLKVSHTLATKDRDGVNAFLRANRKAFERRDASVRHMLYDEDVFKTCMLSKNTKTSNDDNNNGDNDGDNDGDGVSDAPTVSHTPSIIKSISAMSTSSSSTLMKKSASTTDTTAAAAAAAAAMGLGK